MTPFCGFDANAAFVGQSLLGDEPGEAARAVAALFDFGAVVIENSIAEIVIRRVRGFDQKHLIKTDAKMAIAQLPDAVNFQSKGLAHAVDDHEIVTKAVHFTEFEFHNLLSIRVGVSKTASMITHLGSASITYAMGIDNLLTSK